MVEIHGPWLVAATADALPGLHRDAEGFCELGVGEDTAKLSRLFVDAAKELAVRRLIREA